ncbi:glycosyltransferase [Spirosoma endophyticum]|uniref:Glycosyltransferase involved in cell wall bisynthesis n=1 Tax=Spirosoma endophyticum TaxID=662367 RepID=A0A1I2FSF3_9BACT|nr:glycosyltransferase [Spirosoma endophyticum]SFF07809.1 Glycosyltransferase involved in cell wall bisynthesis [Spirosoma endophyticum]
MSVLISVITAVFNDEKFIKKSVESILSQTFGNFEYIIVDDGSTDNTLNILKEIAKKDIRLIVLTQNNLGAAVARNTAINVASGLYIAIQDSDDISLPNRLEKQLYQLLNSDQKLISCTGYHVINENDEVITTNNKLYENINKNILKGSTPALHPTMMIPKDLINQIGGYNIFYNKTEDYDLILRLIENNARLEKINIPLYSYRIRENSESTLNNGAYLKRVFENHLNRINNRPENFSKVVNDQMIDKNYILKRNIREIFYSENYIVFQKLYYKNYFKLPFNYFFFFVFSFLPKQLKMSIKKIFS